METEMKQRCWFEVEDSKGAVDRAQALGKPYNSLSMLYSASPPAWPIVRRDGAP